jgi:ribonuclease Y
MNASSQTDRAEALIARIKLETEQAIGRVLSEAQAQAEEIVATAHRSARQRVHQELAALRRRRSQALVHEAARLDTERRKLRQLEARAEIAAGLPALEAALAGLWASEASRMAWARAALEHAARRLPHAAWTIVHPAGWARHEQQVLAAELESASGHTVQFEADPSLLAGLKVRAGQAWLDASPAALLADHEAIGAALLAETSQDRGEAA